jgi:hypothetical protein
MIHLPDRIEVTDPEGHACYAVYPEPATERARWRYSTQSLSSVREAVNRSTEDRM